MGAPRRPPSGRPRRVGACRAPPAPGLGAGPGRAGRGRCPPPEPPRRGGTQRDQLGGWVVAAGAVPPPPRSGAVPAAPNCGNGAGGRRPHPFIPPPPLGTGTAAPRFPSDPVPVGCREGRASGVGGAEPPRPSAAPHCPPRPGVLIPPLPVVPSRGHSGVRGGLSGVSVAARPPPAALSFSLCGVGGRVCPLPGREPLPAPRSPSSPRGHSRAAGAPTAFGAELAVCVHARFSSCGTAHTCVQKCTPSCTQLAARSCSAAVHRGGVPCSAP